MPLSLAPALAAFVVITIDPVATVQVLNDPIATAAAQKMTPQRYVGYVSKAVNAFDCKADYHTYAIQLTSPTVPAAYEGEGISADMCTPVSPVATDAHPHGREPLRLRGTLPWSGCQQPSFMRSVVRVPVKIEDDSSAVFLELADAVRHRRILVDEDARRRALLRSSVSDAAKPGARSYVEFSDLDEYTGDFACPIDLSHYTEEDEDDYYADTVEASRPPDTMIVVNVSYDLSQLDELPDPLHFFEEKRRLKELEVESRTRKAGTIAVLSPEPHPEIIAESTSDSLVTQEYQSLIYPDTLSSVWEYHKLPELFSTIHIPVSLIREVATKTRRLAFCVVHLREDGVNLLQNWSTAVWFI
ncbi:hypothetical protein B0H19DRAFT_1153785 [Mycena capillaripes]|nr:hypothetical protein B0H19DRAFT_1153785 [Mycena capillaripes]